MVEPYRSASVFTICKRTATKSESSTFSEKNKWEKYSPKPNVLAPGKKCELKDALLNGWFLKLVKCNYRSLKSGRVIGVTKKHTHIPKHQQESVLVLSLKWNTLAADPDCFTFLCFFYCQKKQIYNQPHQFCHQVIIKNIRLWVPE